MEGGNRTVITIITESSLETKLSRELETLGVHGYTITDARGKGARGARNADWDADSNIRIEVICSQAMATSILELLQQKYYDNYAMVAYSHDVLVLRPAKFA